MKRLFTWRYTIIIFIKIHFSNSIEPYALDNFMSEHVDDIASLENEAEDDDNVSFVSNDFLDLDVDDPKNVDDYSNLKNNRDELSNVNEANDVVKEGLRNGPATTAKGDEKKKSKGDEEDSQINKKKAQANKEEAQRERQIQQMYARHESKLKEIEQFALGSVAAAKYFLYEIRRIQKTRKIIDPLREMIQTLEQPMFHKGKLAVLECFRRFFKQIKLPVDLWRHDTNVLTQWHQLEKMY